MNPPSPREDSTLSKSALRLLIAIVVVFALVAIYANIQKLRRDKIESATFIPAESPAPSVSASPR
jgi:hypothetical protein